MTTLLNKQPILPDWMKPYGQTPIPQDTPVANAGMIGADWEQMPMGTNGLAPGQGMFAGSAVNAPITTMNPNASMATGLQKWLADKGIIGSTDEKGIKTEGYGGLALGAAQGLGSLYLGMQQYNLAKDSLANNKAQFERQFQVNKGLTNASLEDRQRARVASNAGAYQSVGDYMNQNGVK
jgi:hypothetical protein